MGKCSPAFVSLAGEETHSSRASPPKRGAKRRAARSLGAASLACWLAIASNAFAQGARPTALPAVEIEAPQERQTAGLKPKNGADRGRRPTRGAIQTPTPAVNAVPAAKGSGTPSSPVTSASERNVSGAEVNAWPFSRPAEALEVVPGLIVTQHSGDGKANQYFLRGFNLDHGTDLAISVDDMPVNMRTHAHGQGYADLNFLIPELIASVNIRKGPYFADEGDFSSVGSVHVRSARQHQQDDGVDHRRELRLSPRARYLLDEAWRGHVADRGRGRHLQWPVGQSRQVAQTQRRCSL